MATLAAPRTAAPATSQSKSSSRLPPSLVDAEPRRNWRNSRYPARPERTCQTSSEGGYGSRQADSAARPSARRVSLELGDGLNELAQPESQLRDALRRSASGRESQGSEFQAHKPSVISDESQQQGVSRYAFQRGRQNGLESLSGSHRHSRPSPVAAAEMVKKPDSSVSLTEGAEGGRSHRSARKDSHAPPATSDDTQTASLRRLQGRLERLRSQRHHDGSAGTDTDVAAAIVGPSQTASDRSSRTCAVVGEHRSTLDVGSPDQEQPPPRRIQADTVNRDRERRQSRRLSRLDPALSQAGVASSAVTSEGGPDAENHVSSTLEQAKTPRSQSSSNADRVPLGLSRRASNSTRSINRDGSPRERSARTETSHALASLEASLARLGARSSSHRSAADDGDKTKSEALATTSVVSEPQPTGAGGFPRPHARRRPSSEETYGHETRAGPARHVQRLLHTEGGLDSAGNSPRKGIPLSSKGVSVSATSTTASPSRTTSTFLERARAARAAEAQKSRERRQTDPKADDGGHPSQNKADRRSEERSAHPQDRSRRLSNADIVEDGQKIPATPTTSGAARAARQASSESDEDEAAVEAQLTPEPLRTKGGSRSSTASPSVETRAHRRRLSQRAVTTTPPSPIKYSTRRPPPPPSAESDTPRHAGDRAPARGAPSRDPHRCLRGVAVLVDVRDADGKDECARWIQLLKACGAKVASRCPSADSRRQLTHIIWKGGKPATLAYFRGLEDAAKPWVVSPQWVRRCADEGVKVPEMEQVVELGREALWARLTKKHAFVAPVLSPSVLRSSLDQVSSLLETPRRVGSCGSFQDVFKAATQHLPEDPSPLRSVVFAKDFEGQED
ncbi:unnamed protein product [Parajaminaea phylloscopi]